METESEETRKKGFYFAKFIFGIIFLLLLSWGIIKGIQVASKYAIGAENYVLENVNAVKYEVADLFGIVKYEIVDMAVISENIPKKIEMYSSAFGMNKIVGMAVADKESEMNPYRFRYEEIWKRDYSKTVPCPPYHNKEECDLLYSSIGIMQISFPIWKDFCEVSHPIELFNVDVNIKCGIRILAECLHRNQHIKSNSKLLRRCYREYNGSGEKAEIYANDIMSRLVNYTIEDREILSSAVMTIRSEESSQETLESVRKEIEEKLEKTS